MEIYWLGHGCFRLKGRDATLITNPAPPSTGYKIGKLPADIVTISRNLPESGFRQAVTGDAKYLTGPGEYEIAGVLISGVPTDKDVKAAGKDRNVAYVIDLDDVRICHLGDVSEVPTGDDVEALTNADVLIVPVGGGHALDAEKAAETVSALEPKIVIPMMYRTEASTGDLEPLETFIKEMGIEAKPAEQRLQITKSSSLPDSTTVMVLNYRG